MSKSREKKEQIVQDYLKRLEKSKSVILTNFSGLKTKNLLKLKDQLSEKGINLKVVKNRLLLLALQDQGIEIPTEILDQPLALAFSSQDEIEPAKIIWQFSQENENLEILGGIFDKKFVEAEKIKVLAMLPSREELYARLVGSINAPKFRLLNVLNQNQRNFIYILKQYQKSIT